MTTATLAPYSIKVSASEEPRPNSPTGTADDIHSALQAAWALNRHTESEVEIFDNRDGAPRLVARVHVEWLDGE